MPESNGPIAESFGRLKDACGDIVYGFSVDYTPLVSTPIARRRNRGTAQLAATQSGLADAGSALQTFHQFSMGQGASFPGVEIVTCVIATVPELPETSAGTCEAALLTIRIGASAGTAIEPILVCHVYRSPWDGKASRAKSQ